MKARHERSDMRDDVAERPPGYRFAHPGYDRREYYATSGCAAPRWLSGCVVPGAREGVREPGAK